MNKQRQSANNNEKKKQNNESDQESVMSSAEESDREVEMGQQMCLNLAIEAENPQTPHQELLENSFVTQLEIILKVTTLPIVLKLLEMCYRKSTKLNDLRSKRFFSKNLLPKILHQNHKIIRKCSWDHFSHKLHWYYV